MASGTRTAKLATVRKDGRPHVVPIWFLLEGNALIFMTSGSSLKARNMRRDPRVCVAVDDETFPYSFCIVEGSATLHALSPAELLPFGTRIAARYVGEERADQYGRRNSVEGEVLVRIEIGKISAYRDVAN